MQRVRVVAQGDAQVGLDVLQLDQLVVEVHHVLSLWLHLDQDLLLAHQLDHLAHVRPRLMQQPQLLLQLSHCRRHTESEQGRG